MAKYFDVFLLRIWDCTPSSRPSIKALIMSSWIFLVLHKLRSVSPAFKGGGHWNNWHFKRSIEASILHWSLLLIGVVYIPLLAFVSWHESKIFRIHCPFLFFKWCNCLYPFINLFYFWYMFSWYMFSCIMMALETDSISIWLRYEVKYSMFLRLNESVTPLYTIA